MFKFDIKTNIKSYKVISNTTLLHFTTSGPQFHYIFSNTEAIHAVKLKNTYQMHLTDALCQSVITKTAFGPVGGEQ